MTTININLLPEEMRAKPGGSSLGGNLPPREAMIPIAIGAVLAIALGSLPTLANMFWLDPRAAAAQQASADIDAQINKYNTTLKSIKEAEDSKEQLRQQLATLQAVAGGHTEFAHMLNELRSLTPANLWFDSLKTDSAKGSIELSGSALDYSSVAFFHHNLSHSDFFQDPVLTHTEMEGGGGANNSVPLVKFQLTVTMKKQGS